MAARHRSRHAVERDFRTRLDRLAADTGTTVELRLDARSATPSSSTESSPLVAIFQAGYAAITGGPLPRGPKPFVRRRQQLLRPARGSRRSPTAPAPAASTPSRSGSTIDDLVRVALLYAATAVAFGSA